MKLLQVPVITRLWTEFNGCCTVNNMIAAAAAGPRTRVLDQHYVYGGLDAVHMML